MKKKTLTQLHKAVWEEIKKLYKNKGNICYTCGHFCEGSGRHIGHGIAKSQLPLNKKYEIKNLKIQCYNCNINLGGNQHIFIAKLEKEVNGRQFLESSCRYVDGAWYPKKDDTKIDSRLFLENFLVELKDMNNKIQ